MNDKDGTPRIKIVIVGTGLGGLAAAYCFARHGHDVELYERKPAFKPSGGAIMIRSGASRFIQSWGLGDAFEAVSDRNEATVYRNWQTSEIVHKRVQAQYSDYPDWGSIRGKLQEIFLDGAKNHGAKIKFGRSATHLSEDANGAEVTLENGEKVQADLVLAADGILSKMRPLVLGNDVEGPILGSVTGHQTEVTSAQLRSKPETAHLADTNELTVWVGNGGYVVGRFNSKLQIYSTIFAMPTADMENPRMWDEVGDIEAVRESFKDWNPSLTTLLSMASSCDRWRLAETPNYPRWRSEHGRLALLGDSIHGMFPDAAQGFSTIIEDIGILNLLLSENRIKDVPSAIRAWQDIRKPRVERIKLFAHTNHYIYANAGASFPKPKANVEGQSDEPVKADRNAPFNTPPFNKWIYDYDGTAEIEKYFAHE